MARFAKIGIGAGKAFDPAKLSPEIKAAFEQGIADAWAEFAGGVKQLNEGTLTSGDILGSRTTMKNNYLNRMLGTIGIYGASRQEAMYPFYRVDADKQKLDGSKRYSLRFAPDQLPPVNAFWSLTMYELPGSWLVDNPLNRYLINSPMVPQFKRDADGGVTLFIQHESPGLDKEANWLPAPKGPLPCTCGCIGRKSRLCRETGLRHRWNNSSNQNVHFRWNPSNGHPRTQKQESHDHRRGLGHRSCSGVCIRPPRCPHHRHGR